MKYYSLYTLLVLFCIKTSIAQKPAIDTSVYDKWAASSEDMTYVNVTNDGKVVSYRRTRLGKSILVIQSTDGKNKREYPNGWLLGFTEDSKFGYINCDGKLNLLGLKGAELKIIADVISARLSGAGKSEQLIYLVKDENKTLTVLNIKTGKQQKHSGVSQYQLNDNGSVAILQKISNETTLANIELYWLDLKTGVEKLIYRGYKPGRIFFNNAGNAISFNSENVNKATAVWYCRKVDKEAGLLSDATSFNTEKDLDFGEIQGFSKDDECLLYQLKEKGRLPSQRTPGSVNLTIWGYDDGILPSIKEQDEEYITKNHGIQSWKIKTYQCAIRLSDKKMNRLQYENEEFFISGKYGIIKRYAGARDFFNSEWSWNRNYRVSGLDLVCISTGQRQSLDTTSQDYRFSATGNYTLSPSGKYLIYYDTGQNDYFSKDLASSKVVRIIKGADINLTADWGDFENSNIKMAIPLYFSTYAYEPAIWSDSDNEIMITDHYDVWKIDLTGKKDPVNLTNGYGRKHDIQFVIVKPTGIINSIKTKRSILLTAFNHRTKDNGFFTAVVCDTPVDPNLLIMAPYVFYSTFLANSSEVFDLHPPVKSRDSDVFIFARMSSQEPWNLFAGKGFKNIVQLTDIHRQNIYNWLTTELIKFKTLDNYQTQGILYKPENFDSFKKYPVIFYYYEKKSDGLNVFRQPEWSQGALDIASYVSNGYLVITPDIQYSIGHPMQSAYNTIVGAANYLSKLPYVDAKHMGLQGHSFGAFETNYIIAHTNLFAAACSAAGSADFISDYNSILKGMSRQGIMYELGQNRMGGSLWAVKENYISESAILDADKITTPILLAHAPNDKAVDFTQGLEFFLALRRLGKKAWLLQYDDAGHALSGKSSVDFTVRMQQFFDHYLKGAPAPRWMVEGITYENRGIEDGFELMPLGVTPGKGINIKN